MKSSDPRPKFLHGLAKKAPVTKGWAMRRISYMIRQAFDSSRPVKVRMIKDSSHFNKLHAVGYTHLVNANKPKRKQYFVIAIDANETLDNIVDLVIHEWAHVLTWDHPESKDHGNAWSRAYGQLYRLIIED